MLTMNNTTYE